MVQIFQKKSGHILGHQCFQLEVDIPFLKFQETHHSEVLELVPEFFFFHKGFRTTTVVVKFNQINHFDLL